MAYLGIKNDEMKGLYYFETISVRDEIAKHFTNPSYFFDGEKEKALKEFGLTDSEIQDGIVLIRKFRNKAKESEESYIGIKGTPYDGVYFFKTRRVRDKVAKQFDSPYLSIDKEGILKEFNIHESEIKDGGFLLSNEVRAYLDAKSKKAGASEVSNAKNTKKDEKSDISEDDVKAKEKKEKVVNMLQNMIQTFDGSFDIVDITMSTGDVYRVALRNLFYVADEGIFQNIAYMDSTNTPCIKENIVDKFVSEKAISIVTRSKITYYDGFVRIQNCDDAYSPNMEMNKMGNYDITHQIDNIILNVNQIVSVVGKDGYGEINLTKLTEDKHKLIYTYLVKKYVLKK